MCIPNVQVGVLGTPPSRTVLLTMPCSTSDGRKGADMLWACHRLALAFGVASGECAAGEVSPLTEGTQPRVAILYRITQRAHQFFPCYTMQVLARWQDCMAAYSLASLRPFSAVSHLCVSAFSHQYWMCSLPVRSDRQAWRRLPTIHHVNFCRHAQSDQRADCANDCDSSGETAHHQCPCMGRQIMSDNC